MSFELDKLDPQTILLLQESNDLLVEESNKVIAEALSDKHRNLTQNELIETVIIPLIGRANMNAKVFAAHLLKNQLKG